MPEDAQQPRFLERFFANSYHGFIERHSKKILGAWAVLVVAATVLVGVVFRPAEEAPQFLREEHPIMKFINLNGEFSQGVSSNIMHVVYGIDREDPFDRSGVDPQTPQGETLGKVSYSSSAS